MKKVEALNIPLDFFDISLWLAYQTILLSITVELLSPRYGQSNIVIDRKRLKNVASAVAVLFIISIMIYFVDLLIF